jgi:hypothetical protein
VRSARLSILLALTAAIALAGCGTMTRTVTVNSPAAALPSPETGAGSSPPTKTSAPPHLSRPAKVLEITAFRTPTGNIGCAIFITSARCDIERRSWSPPARPSSCPAQVDYGQGIEIQPTGTARFVCAGDTVNSPISRPLAYGDATRVDGFECLSSATGLTCRRTSDGRGFFLSIQSYKIF